MALANQPPTDRCRICVECAHADVASGSHCSQGTQEVEHCLAGELIGTTELTDDQHSARSNQFVGGLYRPPPDMVHESCAPVVSNSGTPSRDYEQPLVVPQAEQT